MATSWVISWNQRTCARLIPDHANRRFEIEIVTTASDEELAAAALGTVQDGALLYELDGEVHRTPIATLRGDYRLPDGTTGNRLRQWEKADIGPRPEDIFQERLYCIQWISRETLQLRRQRLFFAAPGPADLAREHMVEAIVRDNLARWQEQGLVPSMPIEPGDKTDEPIRTRGWTYWHHLFPARHLLIGAMIRERMLQFDASILLTGIAVGFCRALNLMSKLTRWRSFQRTGGLTGGLVDFSGDVFYNQALNTVVNYGSRSFVSLIDSLSPKIRHHPVVANAAVDPHPADETDRICDIWVTDPPYADAINYHEITEYFVGWLRKNPPITEWLWDTRRVLALKGRGDGFRKAWSRLTVRSRSTCPTMGCRLSCSPTRTPACGPTWRRSCGVPAYG